MKWHVDLRSDEPKLVGTYRGVKVIMTSSGKTKRDGGYYIARIGKWSAERVTKRDLVTAIKEHVNVNY